MDRRSAGGAGRRERAVLPVHLHGVLAAAACGGAAPPVPQAPVPVPELLRPLAEYEAAAGGGW